MGEGELEYIYVSPLPFLGEGLGERFKQDSEAPIKSVFLTLKIIDYSNFIHEINYYD
jgi:hypothetical protein